MAFAIILAHSLGRFTQGLSRPGSDNEGAGLWRRGHRLARDIRNLIGERDTQGGEVAVDQGLASVRQEAAMWRGRAEAAEARVTDLEARLDAAERTALELRSRVVCLHGKLATTADTLRYQSMTLALDGGGQADGEGPTA